MSSADAPYRLSESLIPVALFREAERQLNICNSCRFCEGYCAVYPALERRTELTEGDIVYLANLCHDCRACLYACMYAPPHEFGVNPPEILAQVRRETYASLSPSFSSPSSSLSMRSTRRAISPWLATLVVLTVVGVVVGLVGNDSGVGVFFHRVEPTGSPYAVMTFAAIVTTSFVIIGLGFVAFVVGILAYWRATVGSLSGLFDLGSWGKALRQGATLEYLRGGAEGCYVKESHASSERRILHYLVSYGFVLCLFSTISAAIEQDLLNQRTPFALLSVPVLLGIVGGAGLVLGSIGLLRIKSTQDVVATDGQMTTIDRAFLIALLALGITGLATLVLRSSPAYSIVLAIHLGVVWSCFALAPMSKFVHFIYRLLALVQNNNEVAVENHVVTK